jgi:hypothetical protein
MIVSAHGIPERRNKASPPHRGDNPAIENPNRTKSRNIANALKHSRKD